MDTEKPDLTQYPAWLRTKFNIVVDNRAKAYYETVVSKIHRAFDASELWQSMLRDYSDIDTKYLQKTGYRLFINPEFPTLYEKSFDSFLLKTYRKNILNNSKWPDTPENGWLLPDRCLGKINDLVRTMFVVKYLDGVEYLASTIESYCNQEAKEIKCDFEAREEGYYAAHINISDKYEIPDEKWDSKTEIFNIEIQITTQLQESIRKLLHSYYEQNRKKSKQDEKWQWDYKSDQFSLNYLGHILHYVEGMIMDIRNKHGGKPYES